MWNYFRSYFSTSPVSSVGPTSLVSSVGPTSPVSSVGPQVPFNDKDFFKGLFGPVTTDSSGVKYFALGSSSNPLQTSNLIVRPCYEHLLPHLSKCLTDPFHGAVTGTPGIGKTVFGAYLIRHLLIERRETVLYWSKRQIYLFSFDKNVKAFYGLNEDHELSPSRSETLFSGKWDSQAIGTDWTVFTSYAQSHNIIFIQDPNEDEDMVSDRIDSIPRVIFIVSYGHKLIRRWASKGYGVQQFYMPTWIKGEVVRCKQFLTVKGQKKICTVADFSQATIDDLHHTFGGCIRDWVTVGLWQEIEDKIKEVVRDKGDNVLQRTQSSKGSVIHLEVPFDEQRPIVGADNSQQQPNSFDDFQYVFGSERILDVFHEQVLNKGNEELRMCLNNWAGQSGFECVYGALFELHCHRMLENNRGALQLNMRIVYKDKTKNNGDVYKVTLPKFEGTCRYPSNDPSILKEDQYKDNFKAKTKYFWPSSNVHPTYDSLVVLNGKDLCVDKLRKKTIALLFQMTVSGATGLPRRPEHSVKQHIRNKFVDVFKTRLDGFRQNGAAYTAFMVPTECFAPFLFQREEVASGDTADYQPDFQLVFEVPNVLNYKRWSPRGRSHADRMFSFSSGQKRKACHIYDEEISLQDDQNRKISRTDS